MGSVGLTLLKKMKQTIREYLFEGLWGSVGFVEDCGFYSHPLFREIVVICTRQMIRYISSIS